jgi:hypothetical protein
LDGALLDEELGVPHDRLDQFIRDAAQGTGKVGLICHPDDRYQDVPELQGEQSSRLVDENL